MASFTRVVLLAVFLIIVLANLFVRGKSNVISILKPCPIQYFKEDELYLVENPWHISQWTGKSRLSVEFQAYLGLRLPQDKTSRDVGSIGDYWEKANALAGLEFQNLLGSRMPLDELELEANKIVISKKYKEYNKTLNPTEIFPPSMNFLLVKDLIEESDIYKIIKKMPKGAALFTWMMASVPLDFMYQLTFENNLYCRFGDQLEFKFSGTQPASDWKLLSELRNTDNPEYVENLNKEIKDGLILPSPDINKTSPTIIDVFQTYKSLTSYKPNFMKMFETALQTLYEDNIMYAELYYDFPDIYDLDGKNYTAHETLQLCRIILVDFIQTHGDFIGARFVYVPIDSLTSENIKRFREISTDLWLANPDLIAGFGVTVRGETEKPYSSFLEELVKFPREMKLYLDGGLTDNWGTDADLDLINSFLLDSHSIGAAITLSKHPVLIEELRKKGVAVKSSPTASQVLNLVPDLKKHPLTLLVALDAPIVIVNVAGTAWNATGLSYDMYEAYMAMTPRFCDLRCLKQFAVNSLLYNSLSTEEKWKSIEAWQVKWNEFIDYVIANNKN